MSKHALAGRVIRGDLVWNMLRMAGIGGEGGLAQRRRETREIETDSRSSCMSRGARVSYVQDLRLTNPTPLNLAYWNFHRLQKCTCPSSNSTPGKHNDKFNGWATLQTWGLPRNKTRSTRSPPPPPSTPVLTSPHPQPPPRPQTVSSGSRTLEGGGAANAHIAGGSSRPEKGPEGVQSLA